MAIEIVEQGLVEVWNMQIPKYICYPTNLYVNEKQDTVWLYGKVKRLIGQHFPDLHQVYTQMLKEGKEGVEFLKVINYNILLSFPTRQTWLSPTNKHLVKRSCCELIDLQKSNALIEKLPIFLPLQVDGFPGFDVDELIDYLQPYLIQIKNLKIILL